MTLEEQKTESGPNLPEDEVLETPMLGENDKTHRRGSGCTNPGQKKRRAWAKQKKLERIAQGEQADLLPTISRSGGDSHPADQPSTYSAIPRDSGDSHPTDDGQEHGAPPVITSASASSRETNSELRQLLSGTLKKSMAFAAIHLDAHDFKYQFGNPAMRDAWEIIKQEALTKGVELTLLDSGIVLAESRGGQSAPRKKHPADDQWYTLAETIEFVFAQGGSFAFAMDMWSNAMVEAS